MPREVQAEVRRVVGRYQDDLRRNADATTTLSRLYKELAVKHLEIGALDQAIAAAAAQAERSPAIGDPGASAVYQEALAVQFLDRRHYQAAWEACRRRSASPRPTSCCTTTPGFTPPGSARRTAPGGRGGAGALVRAGRAQLPPGAGAGPGQRQESAYALAVLLVYELGRPQEAEALLEPLKEKGSLAIDARFLSAYIHYSAGRYLQAIEEYDRIESLAAAKEKKEQAALNRQLVLERMAREKP